MNHVDRANKGYVAIAGVCSIQCAQEIGNYTWIGAGMDRRRRPEGDPGPDARTLCARLTSTFWFGLLRVTTSAKPPPPRSEMLLDHRQLILHDHEWVAAALRLFRAKPALGFSDFLMLELARRAGHLPLGTFECSLGKIEGSQKL